MEIQRVLASLLLIYIWMWKCLALNSVSMEEDDPEQPKVHKHGFYDESGVRLTETSYGIPVSIDNLFEQILSFPSDDQGQNSDECSSGSELSELDMCLTAAQASMFESARTQPQRGRKKRQLSANGFSLWKHGVIPYVFNTTFPAPDRDAILGAMSEWEKATCVRFRPANREDRDVVVFRDGRRCSTNIGRIGREQAVTLAKTCRSKRILIHELGHVIGLIHEHQRHDRDKHVKVLWENIRNMSQERYQFSKLLSSSITDKAVKYDYTSVMHYGRNYFSRSPELTTLQTIDARYRDVIGRAEKPSFNDLETVNRLYQCSAGCPQSLHCGEACYMDSICVCRCPAGLDKAFFNGPGPYRNNLPDPTCEFFASRGECTGNIKDTVRPLCAKSCGLYQPKFNNPPADVWPDVNQLQPKPASNSWTNTADVRGRPGPGIARNNNANNNINNNDNNNNINNVNDVSFMRAGVDTMPMAMGMQRSVQTRPQPTLASQQSYPQEPPYMPSGDKYRQQQQQPTRMSSSQNQQSPEMGAPPVINFRAALLQRQAALSSSEPPIYRSLVLSRSSNRRTARLLLPSHVSNSRSLQRAISPNVQRVNYLQRQDTTRTPSGRLANPTFESLLSPVRSSNTRGSSLSGLNNWLAVSSAQQQQRQQRLQQQNYRQAMRSSSNPSSQRQNRYDVSNYGGQRGGVNSGRNSWSVDNGYSNREPAYPGPGYPTNGRPRGGYGIFDPWQKGRGPTISGQNMPVTVEVDRVNGPIPLADFSGPEFGQSRSASDGTTNADGQNSPDNKGKNLQATGPSFMKSGLIPQNFLLNEQSPPLGNPVEQGSKGVWDQQPAGPVGHVSNYDTNNPQHSAQSFEPSFAQNGPQNTPQASSLWDVIGAGKAPSAMPGNQLDMTNNEPFIDTLSFNSRPGVPIDQVAFSDAQASLSDPRVSQRYGTSNNQQGAAINNNRNRYPSQRFAPQQRQQQRNQRQQMPLYQRLNRYQAFTDPQAASGNPAILDKNNDIQGKEAIGNSTAASDAQPQSFSLASLLGLLDPVLGPSPGPSRNSDISLASGIYQGDSQRANGNVPVASKNTNSFLQGARTMSQTSSLSGPPLLNFGSRYLAWNSGLASQSHALPTLFRHLRPQNTSTNNSPTHSSNQAQSQYDQQQNPIGPHIQTEQQNITSQNNEAHHPRSSRVLTTDTRENLQRTDARGLGQSEPNVDESKVNQGGSRTSPERVVTEQWF